MKPELPASFAISLLLFSFFSSTSPSISGRRRATTCFHGFASDGFHRRLPVLPEKLVDASSGKTAPMKRRGTKTKGRRGGRGVRQREAAGRSPTDNRRDAECVAGPVRIHSCL